MAARTIAITITLDNRDALNAAKAQVVAMQGLNAVTQQQTQLQSGLTNSFIKGNLAARAISMAYLSLRDSLGFAIGGAIEFEHTLTKISAITGTTGGSLKSLENTIRSIAVATNQDQTELAKAALEMGKIGLSGKQVEDALLSVAQLARALDEDLVRTGETVVAILNTYGIAASGAGKVTDELAFTVKASALSIQTFGTAFAYVGGTAAAAGVSLEELQASMDVLSNSGIKASTIGTQLRRIIADLSNEHSKAGALLGGKTLNDYKSFADTLDALANKHLTISDYTELFGRTASSVISILVKYRDTMRGLADETGRQEGLTQRMSDEMNTTLKSAIDGVRVAWANFGIEIMKSDGFLRSVLSNIKQVLENITESNALSSQIEAFRKQDPEAYDAVKYREGGSTTDFATSPAFQKSLSAQRAKDNLEKTKANIVDEIKKILDEGVAKELVKSSEDLSGQIPIKKGFEFRFQQLAQMYTGASEQFLLAVRKAQVKMAQELEPRETDSQLAPKAKKYRPPSPEFDPMDIFDRLEDLQSNGDTYAEDFMKKREKRDNKGDKRAEKSLEAYAEKYKRILAMREEVKKFQLESTAAFAATNIGVQSLTSSIDALAGSIVGLNDFGEAFKGIIKQMIAQLISATIKFALFRMIAVAAGVGTGGLGYAATGGLTDVFLRGLGGVAAPKFASGTDRLVDSPTLFVAGESGRERVSVTPRSKVGQSSRGDVHVHIAGNVFGGEAFTQAVEMAQKKIRKDRI